MKTKRIRLEFKNKNGEILLKKEVSNFPIIIGRKEPADIIIENSFISNSHCRISKHNDKYLFEDLESTNGSFVAKKKIQTFVIEEFAHIRIGTEVLMSITVPQKDLTIEQIPPVTMTTPKRQEKEDYLPRAPEAMEIPNYQYKPLQIYEDLDNFLLPHMDQSYLSFLTAYMFVGALASAAFLKFTENTPIILAGFYMIVTIAGLFAITVIPAAILSLPGKFLKNENSFKKIYFAILTALILVFIERFILSPFTLAPFTGSKFRLLCNIFLSFGFFIGTYIFLDSLFEKKWTHRCASVLVVLLLGQFVLFAAAPKSDAKNYENIYNNPRLGLLKVIPLKEDTAESATAGLLNFDKKVRAPTNNKSN